VIERYSRPEMAALFTDEARLATWLEVELAAAEACEAEGRVPAGTAKRVRERVRLDAHRALEIEAEVHHDVIAFLSMVAESAGDDARHLHHGMTSSDLVDSALAVTVGRAGDRLLAEVAALREATLLLAERHRATVMPGRTHGVHAEPITFGLKALSWAAELRRAELRLRGAVREAAVGKLSGAVGTFAHLPPSVEAEFCRRLGIGAEPVATQVVARDRLAALLGAIALLGAAIERLAVNVRLLQRTETAELFEAFAHGQKGSSAMPHKRNPVLAERLCGVARLLRAYGGAALENVALWDERDISHSSVERVIVADAFLAADYATALARTVVEGLEVRAEKMRRDLESTRGLVFSQRVLLALVAAGLPRDDAYRRVQRHALAAFDSGEDFRERVRRDPEVGGVLGEGLEACFDLAPYLAHVDALFARGLEAAGASVEVTA
jgi:adenylosuccinate lyase